jgi:prophage antirepressor-like protein
MEIINFEGRYINILGSIDTPYFIGSEIGRILGFAQPHTAIWTHVWNENKITYADLGGVAEHNTLKIQPSSILLNEQGLYQLIFASKLDKARSFQQFILNKLPILRTQKLIADTPRLIGNQFVIKNEMDLHTKVVAYIRKYYPDAMINASLGENQDTSEKRIVSYKAGYMKGVPDLHIMEVNSQFNGFFLEFKSPTCKGVLSPHQKQNLERLTLRGYRCYLSDDYDDIIKEINYYMITRRIKCDFCKRKFKNEMTLNNHKKYFHKIKMT